MARKKRKGALKRFAPYIIGISRAIEVRKDEINELNVFPVPDGDTGTNMAQTWASVIAEVQRLPDDAEIDRVWDAIVMGATKGGRGNSGIILSYIIKGAVEVLREAERFNVKTLEAALVAANKSAREHVAKPKEGTILTVIAAMAEAAGVARRKRKKMSDALGMIAGAATAAVNSTPEMISEAIGESIKVIDAGGYGLSVMALAVYDLMTGNTSLDAAQFRGLGAGMVPADSKELHYDEWHEGSPVFDVQGRISPYNEIDEGDLVKFLNGIGDSELVSTADGIVKIHVHTDTPDVVLAKIRSLGVLEEFSIENMQSQVEARKTRGPMKPLGVVAVASGSGMRELFIELGVDEIVDGGQTINPEVGAIMRAIRRVNASSVIVLPGNDNIILAAKEACLNVPEKESRVVATRDMQATIAAMIRYDPERSLDENSSAMTEAMEKVLTGAVAQAWRDSVTVAGDPVVAGDFIGVSDSKVETAGLDLSRVTLELIRRLLDRGGDPSVISLYAGEGLAGVDGVVGAIEEAFPEMSVDRYEGGQPIYQLLIGIE